MFLNIFEVLLRTILSFIFLLIFTRILGNKQISHLTFFNYIAGITFGSIAAILSIDPNVKILNCLISIALWTALTILASFISLKSPKARILIDGEPIIIIKHGKILESSLKSQKLNIDDLCMMLRNESIFNFNDVDYAILEPNGKISVLKKTELQNVTKKDMNISSYQPMFIPSEIISDGRLVKRNLKELNLTEEWVNQELIKAGIKNIRQVFYAEIQADGSLYIDKRE